MVRLQCIQSHMESVGGTSIAHTGASLQWKDQLPGALTLLSIHCGMQTSMWRGEQVH